MESKIQILSNAWRRTEINIFIENDVNLYILQSHYGRTS